MGFSNKINKKARLMNIMARNKILTKSEIWPGFFIDLTLR